MRYIVGTRNSVKSVDTLRPPTTARANGAFVSPPVPQPAGVPQDREEELGMPAAQALGLRRFVQSLECVLADRFEHAQASALPAADEALVEKRRGLGMYVTEEAAKKLLVNELNTMPGLTEVSGYPKMWAASGLSYTKMLDLLIELALERHREKALTKTTRD